jgi:MHS family proline/betaine transporter-like MFS transporter
VVIDTDPASSAGSRRRALRASALGNVVEWYDFGLYGAFANALALTFFPGDQQARTLAVFAAFAVAFLARPAGALLFGHLGDRLGRRNTLAATMLLTSVATALIGVIPGYAAIGWAAPALLSVLRIAQGMGIGGAFGGATAFIVEHAPTHRRGAYGAVQWSTMALGFATGIATGALLTELLAPSELLSWGWRVAFVMALPLGVTSLYIRLATDETPAFQALRSSGESAARPVRDTVRAAHRELVVGLGLVAAISCVVTFFFVFLPTHVTRTGSASASWALTLGVLGLLVVVVVSPVAGALSDRAGRRPVVLCGLGLLLLSVVPACWTLERGGSTGSVVAYVAVGLGLGLAAPSTFLAELFPTRLRVSGLSLTYGIGSALVGGFTPLAATAVLGLQGGLLLASVGIVVPLAGAVTCVVLARETAPAASAVPVTADR